jgi:hypothetical protein
MFVCGCFSRVRAAKDYAKATAKAAAKAAAEATAIKAAGDCGLSPFWAKEDGEVVYKYRFIPRVAVEQCCACGGGQRCANAYVVTVEVKDASALAKVKKKLKDKKALAAAITEAVLIFPPPPLPSPPHLAGSLPSAALYAEIHLTPLPFNRARLCGRELRRLANWKFFHLPKSMPKSKPLPPSPLRVVAKRKVARVRVHP